MTTPRTAATTTVVELTQAVLEQKVYLEDLDGTKHPPAHITRTKKELEKIIDLLIKRMETS